MRIPVSFSRPRRLEGPWRWLLPVLLVLLFLAVLFWLPWQARQMETNERQEQLIADTLWVEQSVRFQLTRNEDALSILRAEIDKGMAPEAVAKRFDGLRTNARELIALTWLDAEGKAIATSGQQPASPSALHQRALDAADLTRTMLRGRYSDPYRVNDDASAISGALTPGATSAASNAPTLLEYHAPYLDNGKYRGGIVATYSLGRLLEETVPWWFAQDNAISLVDQDDTILAKRAAAGPGRGVYTHKRALDLPGATLFLSTDSVKSAPRLLPNLLVGSVIALALGLLASLLALWRHIMRRLAAEGALRQQMAFRTAMENSMVTGLRARDLEGRITYVNPAFCQLVGSSAEELIGRAPPMPYWAPEAMAEYEQRFAEVLAGHVTPQVESIFRRPDGARIPVLIFEAPLVDSKGVHTGWMGSILDISDRKRAEELNRQQQEKLHASARLATMGEISSMLAHELNQPLAAISSYTTGALNVLERAAREGRSVEAGQLQSALEQASVQARRAGQIIRSVHEFVKKREPQRQQVDLAELLDAINTLIELQARKYFVSIQTAIPPNLPTVSADRMLLEQVLLNLTRNGVESMQEVAPERRLLRIEAVARAGQVEMSVIDQGHGIAQEVAERLFSPFFSTKAEGMGMGLSICRTAIEFHGGTLTHRANPNGGTIFTFTLPAQVAAP